MFRLAIAALAIAIVPWAAVAQDKEEEASDVELESIDEKISYTLGFGFGRQLNEGGVEADIEKLIDGLRDALAGKSAALTQEEQQAVMRTFSENLRKKQQEVMAESGAKNAEEGAAFLKENAERDEVITTDSGLQYEIIKKGNGKIPEASDGVSVHYTGKLLDGTVFDSSVERDSPIELPAIVGPDGRPAVIQGWVEALQLMPVGSKWRLYIPSSLGYGPNGAGQAIGPNATLVFDVELLDITTDDQVNVTIEK